jgi:hypothetical protein
LIAFHILDPSGAFLTPPFPCSIEAKEGTLEVSAATGPSYYYRGGATFAQSFRLGTNVDVDAISAAYRGGVLTLRLPYKPRKPTTRRIVVEGPAAPTPRLRNPEPAKAAPLPTPAVETPAPAPREEPAPKHASAPTHNNNDEEGEEMPELEPLIQDVDPAEATAAAVAAKPMSRGEKAAAWVAKHSQSEPVEDEEDGSIEECDIDA